MTVGELDDVTDRVVVTVLLRVLLRDDPGEIERVIVDVGLRVVVGEEVRVREFVADVLQRKRRVMY